MLVQEMHWDFIREFFEYSKRSEFYSWILNSQDLDDFMSKAPSDVISTFACEIAEHYEENIDWARPLICTSQDALAWAWIYPPDREAKRPLIKASHDAATWAIEIGDRDLMRPLVTEGRDCALWARCIADDYELMRDRIKDSKAAEDWLIFFPEDREYFKQKGLIT